jgi:hypothetical protein
MIKLWRMRWVGHVARKGEKHTEFVFQKLKEID